MSWPILNFIIILARNVGYSAMYFLIWNELRGIREIVTFNLATFTALLISAMLLDIFLRHISTKVLFALGLIITAGGFIYVGTVQFPFPALAGFFFGMGAGMQYNLNSALNLTRKLGEDLTKSEALLTAIHGIVTIIAPLILGFLVSKLGYAPTLILAGTGTVICAAGVALLKIPKQGHKVDFFQLLTQPKDLKVFRISFAVGIVDVFKWGLLNVIILGLLGGIAQWSVVASGLAMVNIFMSYIISKFDLHQESRTKSLVLLSSFSIVGSLILLLNNFSLVGFLVFAVLYEVNSTMHNVLTKSYYVKELETFYPGAKESEPSFLIYFNFARDFGRLMVMIFLLLIPASVLTPQWLLLILSLASLGPLVLVRKY